MTREEAIKWLEETIQDTDTYWESCSAALQKELDEQKEVFLLALSALRPVSRERVILCKDCQYWQGNNGGYPHPECRWGNDETPDEDDYCSFAERLEVSKNG